MTHQNFGPRFVEENLGPKYIQIHVHYNINPNLEMMTEKLQLFLSFQESNEYKVLWFK
jgi:hypothetical protein